MILYEKNTCRKYAANVEDWISRKPIFADGLEEIISALIISAPTVIEAEE